MAIKANLLNQDQVTLNIFHRSENLYDRIFRGHLDYLRVVSQEEYERTHWTYLK